MTGSNFGLSQLEAKPGNWAQNRAKAHLFVAIWRGRGGGQEESVLCAKTARTLGLADCYGMRPPRPTTGLMFTNANIRLEKLKVAAAFSAQIGARSETRTFCWRSRRLVTGRA
jgi:hypothetical protein